MFLSRSHKVIIIWNPKTGSTSLHRYLRLNVPDADFGPDGPDGPKKGHWNARICQCARYWEITMEELTEYRIASFWRDPIDRMLSSYGFHQRTRPDVVGSMTFMEYMEQHGKEVPPQWMYLTDRNIEGVRPFEVDLNWEWFNFHDYQNEFKRLAGWFGLTPGEVAPRMFPTVGNEIPYVNVSTHIQVEDLSQEEINFVKNTFRTDYELLESEGIFPLSRDL